MRLPKATYVTFVLLFSPGFISACFSIQLRPRSKFSQLHSAPYPDFVTESEQSWTEANVK